MSLFAEKKRHGTFVSIAQKNNTRAPTKRKGKRTVKILRSSLIGGIIVCSIIFQYQQLAFVHNVAVRQEDTIVWKQRKKVVLVDNILQHHDEDEEEFVTLQQLIQGWDHHDNDDNYNNTRLDQALQNYKRIIRPGIRTDAYRYEVKWPQKDDRIQQAILKEGRLIYVDQTPVIRNSFYRRARFKSPFEYYPCNATISKGNNTDSTTQLILCEAPPRNLATIVTAFYNVNSKYNIAAYLDWLPNMFAATDPMVIFVEPGVDRDDINWVEFVKKHRQHAPTIVVPISFDNLTMTTTFADTFWRTLLEKDDRAKLHRDLFVYKIWNEKIIFTHNVAHLNPFGSHEIFWLDAGNFRDSSKNYTAIIQNNITRNGVPKSKVLLQNTGDSRHDPYIAGNAWGGKPLALNRMYEKYIQTFWFMVNNPQLEGKYYTSAGDDQNVLLHMCLNFPTVCYLYEGAYFRQMLSDNWLSNRNFWLGSKPVVFNLQSPVHVRCMQYPENISIIDQNFLDSHPPVFMDV